MKLIAIASIAVEMTVVVVMVLLDFKGLSPESKMTKEENLLWKSQRPKVNKAGGACLRDDWESAS